MLQKAFESSDCYNFSQITLNFKFFKVLKK